MKNLLKLGKALNKAEQKMINGGAFIGSGCAPSCPPTWGVFPNVPCDGETIGQGGYIGTCVPCSFGGYECRVS